MSLLYAPTCFKHYVLIIRRSKLYYTASGIITPVGGRPVHRLRESCLNLCTGRPPTECDDTRCCIPYILESNPHPFYSFRGLKNQMRIRIACRLDSWLWAVFWKNDRATVRAVRTIQYNNLLFYLLFIILYNILYNIYNLLFIRLTVITHNWISLPCRQGAVEGKVRIRTAN
jgi:hypothetical protein